MGANEMEAWGVSRLVVALGAGLRARGLSLAVITPYNAHKELIKKNLKMLIDPYVSDGLFVFICIFLSKFSGPEPVA